MADGVRLAGEWLPPGAEGPLLAAEREDLRQLGRFLRIWWNDQPTITFHTSGSTGAPQPIVFEKKIVIQAAQRSVSVLGIPPGSRALLSLPLTYIAGQMMVIRALVAGLDLIPVPPSTSPWNESLPTIHLAAFTPHQLSHQDLLAAVREVLADDGVLLLGGAPVSPDLEEQVQCLPGRVYETYGMTETLTHVALRSIVPEREESFSPLPGVRLSVDPDSCLVIEDALQPGKKIRTHDVVELDQDHFRWIGRLDRVINSGGIKIQPERVEAVLRTRVPDVPFFVGALPHKRLGEEVGLWIESSPDPRLEHRFRRACTALPSVQRPRKILFLPEFRYTPTGKVDRLGTIDRWRTQK
ncbi:MAG: O-succinylbenzoic acid--CoA ligase [Candidatus Neomarinimicrobiota bacterium]|nr:MAG: O-succinylbenzoic acid--CoA ligase [Candidatus Neomarinimicrobiota bacterium]